jgi:hypothetical protein
MVNKRLNLVFALSLIVLSSTQLSAGFVYLNGIVLSGINTTTGANTSEPGEYDSFVTPNSDAFINGTTGTPVVLNAGANSFTITGQEAGYNGLGLYFTTTSTLLQGANGSQPDFGRAPDLWVYFGTNGFAMSTAGTAVATIGQFSGTKQYSGAQSFTIDSQTITVTAWNGNNLQLNVSAVPEPMSTSFVAMAGCLITYLRKRRRTN